MIQNNQFTKESIKASLYLVDYGRWKSWYLFHRIVDNYFKINGATWNPESGEFESSNKSLENNEFFFESCRKAIKVMEKEESKMKAKTAWGMIITYVLGVIFWSSVIQQTHGMANKVSWVIGFALFYIPWWAPALMDKLEDIFYDSIKIATID